MLSETGMIIILNLQISRLRLSQVELLTKITQLVTSRAGGTSFHFDCSLKSFRALKNTGALVPPPRVLI